MNNANWTDNTEAWEDANFLTQEEYDAIKIDPSKPIDIKNREDLMYVSFKDGINFTAISGTFSILPDHFWDLTNFRPPVEYII